MHETTSGAAVPRRNYGGWRKPSSPGLGSLTLIPTMGVFAALLTSIGVLLFAGIVPGLVAALINFPLLLPLLVGRDGRNMYWHWTNRLVWWRTTSQGSNLYRSGPLGVTEAGQHNLPGLLAATHVWDAQDTFGHPFALIENRKTGHWTVVLAVNPNGAALISGDDLNNRVAGYDHWLASLGREPGIEQVAVVIDQVPDAGELLRAAVERAMDKESPEFAQRVLRETGQHFPTGGTEVAAFVAITFNGRELRLWGRDRKAVAQLAAVEIGTRLPGLASTLAATGAGAGKAMTSQVLAERVRSRFDPAIETKLAQIQAMGEPSETSWEEAGPVAGVEGWDTVRYDSGLHRTFEMTAPPRGAVYDTVLAPLLTPQPNVRRKRVAIFYRPLPADVAPAALDRQVRTALVRSGRRAGVVHAHDSVEVRAAMQAAQEEATGAGVVNFSILVTVTACNEDDTELVEELRVASDAVQRAGRQAQLKLRPVFGGQAAAFQAALGIGVVLPSLTRTPQFLRDNS